MLPLCPCFTRMNRVIVNLFIFQPRGHGHVTREERAYIYLPDIWPCPSESHRAYFKSESTGECFQSTRPGIQIERRGQPGPGCMKEIQLCDLPLCHIQHPCLMSFLVMRPDCNFSLNSPSPTSNILPGRFYQVPTLGVPAGSFQFIFYRPTHLGVKAPCSQHCHSHEPWIPWGGYLLNKVLAYRMVGSVQFEKTLKAMVSVQRGVVLRRWS